MAKMPILLPVVSEQTKISKFLKYLNNYIVLHQRKINILKKLTQHYLSVIFPKNNKNSPELRFMNFKDAWEQRKLKEVAEINPKSNLPSKFKYINLESVIGNKLVNFRDESLDSAPSRAQRLAKKDDIFFQTVRPYQKNNYLFDLNSHNYVFSTGYAQLRTSLCSKFLLYGLQDQRFVDKVLKRSTGTSYPAINSNDLALIEFKVPNNEEQNKIGDFLKLINDYIELHQKKLDKLSKVKQAYLKKMFI